MNLGTSSAGQVTVASTPPWRRRRDRAETAVSGRQGAAGETQARGLQGVAADLPSHHGTPKLIPGADSLSLQLQTGWWEGMVFAVFPAATPTCHRVP